MRLFEYCCKNHGAFELVRPVGLRQHPAPCPECGKLSARAYTAPRTPQIDSRKKSVIERNIKSQFEPHVCSTADCSHDSKLVLPPSHRKKPKAQRYQGPRPWVIEHAV